MKNKKGFTLIELIAVIALLAVILLLIVPNVVNILGEGREDAFVNQIQSIMRASENEYGTNLVLKKKASIYCSDPEIFNGGSYDDFTFDTAYTSEGGMLLAYNIAAPFFDQIIGGSDPCVPLDLNLSAVKYIIAVNNQGKITAVGVQDKNYCYVSNNPSIEVDKDDLSSGELICEGRYCYCSDDPEHEVRIDASSNGGDYIPSR